MRQIPERSEMEKWTSYFFMYIDKGAGSPLSGGRRDQTQNLMSKALRTELAPKLPPTFQTEWQIHRVDPPKAVQRRP